MASFGGWGGRRGDADGAKNVNDFIIKSLVVFDRHFLQRSDLLTFISPSLPPSSSSSLNPSEEMNTHTHTHTLISAFLSSQPPSRSLDSPAPRPAHPNCWSSLPPSIPLHRPLMKARRDTRKWAGSGNHVQAETKTTTLFFLQCGEQK